jgi:hypothetical protein
MAVIETDQTWRNLKTAGGINERVYDKIVDANPRTAYAS